MHCAGIATRAQLDRVREDLAYLKLWQGVGVVTDISVVGWLVATSAGATQAMRTLAVAVATVLTLIIVVLHHRIGHRIKLIESL
jgi:hypothetical protein